ncbi:MAG: TonB-dependent receptor [Candidatus Omnitrophica bacterium]|nr:TonB-dependent receptor [Candidatus Omnitrophota bacterium]
MNKILIFIISGLCFNLCAFAEEPHTLEKITVRPQSGFSTQVVTASEISGMHLDTVADILDHVSGIDLRYRGTQGIQADLTLRGSTFEQVALLIDGVRVNDPQTGHHNLDIPLTLFDVERIEVVKEGDSAFYGAGGIAGSVNIITKKPKKKALRLDTLFGQHALFGQAGSLSLPADQASGRVSFDHKISKAARPNTDFEYKTASIYLTREFDSSTLDTLFGYQKKDFGADSFYSNLFPEEEEHTETIFSRTGLESKLGFGTLKNNLFFRKHRDKFILRRNSPTPVNYHTTYVYGLNSDLTLPTKYGDLALGLDVGRDEIYSSNLGKHTRIHEAGSFGFTPKLGERLSADLRARLDYYQKWHTQESFNVGLGYDLIPQELKVRGSASRAFRIPSFTELYYSDAANKGNPDLGVETSDNFRLGLSLRKWFMELGVDGFLRQGRNLIDWTRTRPTDRWQATNLGRIDFRGIELNSKIKPNLKYGGLRLDKMTFSYNYTGPDKQAGGFYSKYALDILKHQYLLGMDFVLFGLDVNWQFSYNRRYYGETYFVGNVYLGKRFLAKDFSFEPFLKIDNFSNTRYTEVAGVLQPRRWIKSGVKFEW